MAYPVYSDSFEQASIDARKWRLRQIEERQIGFSADAASGNQAVVVTVTDGDGGVSCSKPCQRAEIRTHGNLRPEHGDEFWHGFVFRVSGDIPNTGSLRTVLSQWKAPGDESPFLAQRFDNGVFHVTVQDGPNRRTVASAKGDPDRLDRFQDMVAEMSKDSPGVVQAARAFAELGAVDEDMHPLNRNIEKFPSLSRASRALANCELDEVQNLFNEFSFVQELDAYCVRPSLTVRHMTTDKLPDPKQEWVRMAYRIKPGRRDNNPDFGPRREGEIDIYANGQLFVEVRGDIGYKLESKPSDRTVYFKFGIYRDLTPGRIEFHFDEFVQSDRPIGLA